MDVDTAYENPKERLLPRSKTQKSQETSCVIRATSMQALYSVNPQATSRESATKF